MSGHSKRSTIQHRKWAQDKIKWKIYWKHSKLIAIAARWWDDLEKNTALKSAVDNAKAENVPADNIKRAIEKWAWTWKNAATYTEWLYEAYWPWWIAILISTLSDNTKRTTTDVKTILAKKWWNYAESWSVSWMFSKKWEITVDLYWKDVDEFEMFIMESWAEDFEVIIIHSDNWWEDLKIATVTTEISDFTKVRDLIKSKWYKLKEAAIWWIPNQEMKIENNEDLEKLNSLIWFLEENDDVDNVYTNLDS